MAIQARPNPMTRRRLAAVVALFGGLVTVAGALVLAVDAFPRGFVIAGLVLLATAGGWYGVLRRGRARLSGWGIAALALSLSALVVVFGGGLLELALLAAGMALGLAAARIAFTARGQLSPAASPRRPVLFMNPRSGGGKAERFALAAEARARGIDPVEIVPGDDLRVLVRDAVTRGADGLAMAGGDGSQAIVAALAAEHGLAYACVPAGTRNHFALDLGVDREDVVGALDAFVDGGERRVDLAEVNGRVFVNNVSLGLYAEAVQREGYRDAKLRTLLDTVPDVLGPDAQGVGLRWTEPGGTRQRAGAVILVSNNRYRLGRAIGSGTRPRIDAGLLGVAVIEPAGFGRPWREWSTSVFDVDADDPVPAGIDGEAVMLEPPLRFRIRPAVLRVRVARAHPGASPSATAPEGVWEGVRALVHIAGGDRTPAGAQLTPTQEA